VIFVDELNKFAPSSLSSPLKSQLINITARGRSSNVALIGAEQFASEVDKQIFDNCATRVFGRTGSSEISGQVYRRLSDEMRVKLTSLPQGVMLVDNNRFAEPLLARFPLPPCIPGDRYLDS
jgi:DNA helicase HerA-like ATPase